MRIEDLNGQLAKISKNSITIKDDAGKTVGVITHCCDLAPRDSSEIWGKVRKTVGLEATKCISKMRKANGKIVYLENVNTPDPNAIKLQEAGFTVARYRRLA